MTLKKNLFIKLSFYAKLNKLLDKFDPIIISKKEIKEIRKNEKINNIKSYIDKLIEIIDKKLIMKKIKKKNELIELKKELAEIKKELTKEKNVL